MRDEMVSREADNGRHGGRRPEVQFPPEVRERFRSLIDRAVRGDDRDAALHGATSCLAEATGADWASALVPVGPSVLRVVASSEQNTVGDLIISLDRYPELQRVLTHGTSVLVADVEADPILEPVIAQLRHAAIRSIAAVPVNLGEVTGILRLTSCSRSFGAQDLALLHEAALVAEETIAARALAPESPDQWRDLALHLADAILDVALDGRIVAVHGSGVGRLIPDEPALVGRSLMTVLPQLARDGGETSLLDLLLGDAPPRDAPFLARFEGRAPVPIRMAAERRDGFVPGLRLAFRRWEPAFDSPDELLQHLPLAVIGVHRSSGGTAFVNTAAQRLIGASAADLAGRPVSDILRGSDDDATLLRRDERPLPVRVVRRPDPAVDLGLDMLVVLDASALSAAHQREEMMRSRLRRQRDELEQLYHRMSDFDALRTKFLSAAAHELKTPLTVIQTYVEALRSDLSRGLDAEQLGFLDICHESVLRLRRLVADLVDLAALETGQIQLNIGRTPMAPAAASVTREMTAIASRSGVHLSNELASDVADARADGHRVEQVLRNLIDNAIKYTPAGGTVVIRGCAEEDSVRLEVVDSGIGIPEDHLEAIFDEFVQIKPSQEDRRRGAGLGLSICRRIVRSMGGRIAVISTVGMGSTFTVQLPRFPDDAPVSHDSGVS